MPTHYREGIFMPGDNLAYDAWLSKSFSINQTVLDNVRARQELIQNQVFLEYSAYIIRHDMHSGINTYLPRGLKMLLQRLPEDVIKENKLQVPLKLLESGLLQTQRVYHGVHAFTNLVKVNSSLDTRTFGLKGSLIEFFEVTAFHTQITYGDLGSIEANESLMCTAIGNFVKNGLTHNNNPPNRAFVHIDRQDDKLLIKDNGMGLTMRKYNHHAKPIKKDQLHDGVGISIANAILEEHGFRVSVKKIEDGTELTIHLNKE